jgi:two-component system chemotaxis response regulator CheY
MTDATPAIAVVSQDMVSLAQDGSPRADFTPVSPACPDAAPRPEIVPARSEPMVVVREMDLAETVAHLLKLLPGKVVATGFSDHHLGLSVAFDAKTYAELEPILHAGCDYTPYVPPAVKAEVVPLNAHILIVEDTLVSRLMLRRTLEQLPGCRVSEANSGREALALLAQGPPPDLIISDVAMPEMDGLTLVKEIRATPTLAHVDVMLCTASTERDTVLRAAELNVCRYLVKPFEPGQVKEQVRETLIQSAARHYRKLEELQERVGLCPEGVVEVLRGLGQQLVQDVSAIRTAFAGGRRHAAEMILQGLKGSCNSIKDIALVNRIEKLLECLSQGDLTGTLDGLEVLRAEGLRVSQMAEKFALVLSSQDLAAHGRP